MELNLISRRYHKKYQVAWIQVTTNEGSLVVQANHAPFIASLVQSSECSFLIDNNNVETLLIQQGVVEVTRNGVRLLIHEE